MKILNKEPKRAGYYGHHSEKTLKGLLLEAGYTASEIEKLQASNSILILPDSLRKHLETNERLVVIENGLLRQPTNVPQVDRFQAIAKEE